MKKSVEILGLPIISITEGRELGMSKTLLINAAQGQIAAITIEDADWYRGVKLIPYESVIAIGEDAVTISNSENILKLDDAGDYNALLDDNIRIIGTKAITRTGTIQGKITELYVGDDGHIMKCEITAPDGTTTDVTADQISIFGKQVTVIDPTGEKKNDVAPAAVAPAPAPAEEPVAPPTPEPTPVEVSEPEIQAMPEVTEEPAPETVETPQAEVQEEPATPEPAPIIEAEPAAEPVSAPTPAESLEKSAAEKAAEERHRRFLLGKKAARTIKMDNGIVIVEADGDITEEVLQKAKLANKFIELSMNVK